MIANDILFTEEQDRLLAVAASMVKDYAICVDDLLALMAVAGQCKTLGFDPCEILKQAMYDGNQCQAVMVLTGDDLEDDDDIDV